MPRLLVEEPLVTSLRWFLPLIAVAACAGWMVGCGTEASSTFSEVGSLPPSKAATSVTPDGLAPATAPPTATPTLVADEANSTAEPVGPEAAVPPKEGPEAVDDTAKVADYQPPFPDRVDLFVPPKREGGQAASGNESAIELLGFVRVDRLRAILKVNGEVTPMAAGDTRLDLEVISVNPPNVLLQRGRQRWQATLE